MTPQPIEQHLHNMGYRPLDNTRKIWAKPWGYTLCSFEIDTKTWQQTFRSYESGEPCVWSRVTWDEKKEESFVQWIAYAETYHSHQFAFGTPWNFHTELQLGPEFGL